MTTKENVAANSANAAKKIRRGVSNETVAVSQLKFSEKDAARNGLFIVALNNVSVDWSQNADGKTFTGLRVPRLTFEFVSIAQKNPKERRHVYHTIFPVESNVDTIPGGKYDWQVDNIFKWIKHVLEVFYLKGREFTDEETDALELSFIDFEENEEGQIEYVSVDPQDVLNGYRSLFENTAAMLNGSFGLKDGETAKPVYKTADGKDIPCWIKLLRCTKNKNKWRNVAIGNNAGDLAVPSFVGSGILELVKGSGSNIQSPAIVRLDVTKESITPQKVDEAPSVGIPQMPGMGGAVVAGAPAMPGFANPASEDVNPAYAGAGDDMPF